MRSIKDSGILGRFAQQRLWAAFVLYAALGGCMAPEHPTPDTLPDAPDFQRREECLHRKIAQLISEQGDKPTMLQSIAVMATGLCSQEIWVKMAKNNSAFGKDFLMAGNDKVQTERYALQVAVEIKKIKSKK